MQQSRLTPELSSNALRYAAGYVIRHICKKIGKITEDDLISCCRKLVKEGYDPSDPSTCKEWTDLVGRGGLWHIRETTFQLLCALEEEIRTYLDALSSPNAADLRTQFVEKLIMKMSEDVQFYWCITTADFEVDDVEVHDHLLEMIVELSGDFLMQVHG